MKLTSCGRCINSVVVPRDFIAGQGDSFPFDGEVVLPPTVESTAGPERTRFDPELDATELEFCFDVASSDIVA